MEVQPPFWYCRTGKAQSFTAFLVWVTLTSSFPENGFLVIGSSKLGFSSLKQVIKNGWFSCLRKCLYLTFSALFHIYSISYGVKSPWPHASFFLLFLAPLSFFHPPYSPSTTTSRFLRVPASAEQATAHEECRNSLFGPQKIVLFWFWGSLLLPKVAQEGWIPGSISAGSNRGIVSPLSCPSHLWDSRPRGLRCLGLHPGNQPYQPLFTTQLGPSPHQPIAAHTRPSWPDTRICKWGKSPYFSFSIHRIVSQESVIRPGRADTSHCSWVSPWF